MTAPERICAPTSPPFSTTQTVVSGWSCFRRMAAARPAGPAPTITTSNSIASRSDICFSPCCQNRNETHRAPSPGGCTFGNRRRERAMDALAALALQIEWGADEALAEHALDRRVARPAAPAVRPAATAAAPPPVAAAPAMAPPGARAGAGGGGGRPGGVAGGAGRVRWLRPADDRHQPGLRRRRPGVALGAGRRRAGRGGGPRRRALRRAAGLFLDRMLASIGLDRAGLYATSLLPWRPPGDRKPADTEIQLCLPFLWRHLALLQPRRVVLLGALAARTLLPAAGRRGARLAQPDDPRSGRAGADPRPWIARPYPGDAHRQARRVGRSAAAAAGPG